jgi:opacity protein-like surface antigen
VDRPQVSKPQTSKTSTPHPQVRKPTVTKPQVQTPKASTPKISTPTQSHPQIEKKSHTTPTKVRVERPTEQKPVESQVGAPQKKQPTSHKQPSKSRAPSLTNYENQPAQWTSGFNSGLNDPRRQNGSNSSVNKMDRKGKTSLSISSLSYASGYNSGMDYQDGGLGIALGIRPLKNVGGEISYGQYTDSLFSTDPDRLNRPIQAVAQGFFLPDEMFTPFVSAGYVQNSIYLNDQYSWNGNEEIAKQQSTLTGAVLGAGIEVNLSSSLSLDFDARYLLYTNAPETKPATNNATLTSVGVNFYF